MRAAVCLVLALACGTAAAGDRIGSEACGRCHPAALAVWQQSAHARAGRRFAAAPPPRCQPCHSADAGAPRIGCEACHGDGAAYAPDDVMRDPALARALGLRQLATPAQRAALCARCHRAPTRLVPFDAELAWQRIKHG